MYPSLKVFLFSCDDIYVYTITDRPYSQCTHLGMFFNTTSFFHTVCVPVYVRRILSNVFISEILNSIFDIWSSKHVQVIKKYDLVYLIPQKVKIWRIWFVVVHGLWCLPIRLCHPNRLCQLSIDVRLNPLSANPTSPTGKYMGKVRHQNVRQACSVIRFFKYPRICWKASDLLRLTPI